MRFESRPCSISIRRDVSFHRFDRVRIHTAPEEEYADDERQEYPPQDRVARPRPPGWLTFPDNLFRRRVRRHEG